MNQGEDWLVAFDISRQPGERPVPICLTAMEHRTGRQVRVGQENLSRSGPPYPMDSSAIFVAYDAPAALGCHLTLGWPMPSNILDLHAEFRCLMSGLDVPGGYALERALAHFEQRGEGVEALAKLLTAMLPHIDLPRALLRGS
jgi:DNA polymerase I